MAHDLGMYAINEDPMFHRVKIGEFTICRQDDKSLWIQDESGEGGQFKEESLAEVIRKYYKEHF